MNRSILLVLVAALALAVGVDVTASADTGKPAEAQAAAKAGKQKAGKQKGAKKKAARCKAKAKAKPKRKGKARGRGKARRSALADSAAKRRGKAKGKRKAKRCGKAKPKARRAPTRRPERVRSPYEQRLVDRLRERMENRPQPAPLPTIQDMVPADGTYASSAAPGLSVTIGANATTARVVYTVPKALFGAECQPHTPQPDGMLVDLSGPLEPSQSTKRGHLLLHASQTVDPSTGAARSWSVVGSIGKDGSFTLSVSASFPFPDDVSATCSAFPPAQLSGTLVRQ